MLLISIIALGLGEDIPFLQIPAGASVLLTFSVFLMFVGAFTFWFRKIGPLAFVIIILALVSLDRFGFFDGRHQALGMNYDKIEPYTAETLNRHTSEHTLYSDYLNTVTILNKWKDSYQAFHGVNKKPKAILVCVSGGGLRSSYFTFRSIQILDSMSHGAFFDHTRMISGASGGILGASYFRELYWLNKRGLTENIYEKSKSDPIVKDLLNRIAFKIVSGIFLPHLSENIGSRSYASDRGYSLDDQVMANIPLLRNRRLGDYTQPESEALIPMLIMSPVIINDGRKLFISSTPVSYMTRTVNPSEGVGLGVTGVEFRRFFKNQEPDSLLFVTAFRMNASFPGITPFVSLPSEPPLKLIDAGVADNFGITVAMRFLYVFREWFAANTEGVMILQIRDTERETVARNYHKKSLIGKMMDPLGAFYNAYTQSRDLANEDFLNFSGGLFKGKLQFTSIQYVPEDSAGTKASLSWHLTARERDYIEHSTRQPRNQEVFQYVTDWIKNAEKGGIGHFSFRMEERDSATGK